MLIIEFLQHYTMTKFLQFKATKKTTNKSIEYRSQEYVDDYIYTTVHRHGTAL